jgi:hypothetical protein
MVNDDTLQNKHYLLRYGIQRLQAHWHKCPQNRSPKPWKADDIPSISGGMLAGSKLLSNKGENSFYHLNESLILEEWLKNNGHVMVAVFLAFKGSRFNWHVEAATTYLVNLDWLVHFMHKLLVAVTEPNRLVLAVFNFLSCKIAVAGLASRSIFFVEVIAPLRFVYKALASRWDVRLISDIAIEVMEAGLLRGHLLGRLRVMRDDAWAKKVVWSYTHTHQFTIVT